MYLFDIETESSVDMLWNYLLSYLYHFVRNVCIIDGLRHLFKDYTHNKPSENNYQSMNLPCEE